MKKFMLAFMTLLCAADASAQNVVWWERWRVKQTELKFNQYLQQLSFGGDLRLRNEAFWRSGPAQTDRNRFRYRIRMTMAALIPWNITVFTRVASGTGEQTSTNQSFDNLGSQKEIWVDQVFARWDPIVSLVGDGTLYMQGGRMPNRMWRLYSSDLVWDDDFNPEGFAQGTEWLLPNGMIGFANAMQAVADEDSNTSRNQWIFSQQAGLETKLPFETRLRAAAAYHVWTDTLRSSLSQVNVQNGNRRAGGVLLNNFRVAEVTGQLSGWAGQMPVRLQATAIRNVAARGIGGLSERDGFQAGAILGQARMPGMWEVGLFRKYVESDATIADVADSDFGDGGTNMMGYVGWIAYCPAEWMDVRAKYFAVRTLEPGLAPGDRNIRRLQLDMSLRF